MLLRTTKNTHNPSTVVSLKKRFTPLYPPLPLSFSLPKKTTKIPVQFPSEKPQNLNPRGQTDDSSLDNESIALGLPPVQVGLSRTTCMRVIWVRLHKGVG